MAAIADQLHDEAAPATPLPAVEPMPLACPTCTRLVFAFAVGGRQVLVEPYEWEPRAACPVCASDEACRHCGRAISERRQAQGARYCDRLCRQRAFEDRQRGQRCPRCDGDGYVGSDRPTVPMLGWDVAWSDEGHVRMVGPKTNRKRGEGLYPIHACRVDLAPG